VRTEVTLFQSARQSVTRSSITHSVTAWRIKVSRFTPSVCYQLRVEIEASNQASREGENKKKSHPLFPLPLPIIYPCTSHLHFRYPLLFNLILHLFLFFSLSPSVPLSCFLPPVDFEQTTIQQAIIVSTFKGHLL